MLHTADLTSLDMTGYTLDSTAGAWPQQLKFTFPGHLFAHLCCPDCPCGLKLVCNIYSRLCPDYGIMIGLTDGPQQLKFTFPGHLFAHLGCPDCPCGLKLACNIYSRLCPDHGIMIGLTDGEGLFPSLYLSTKK